MSGLFGAAATSAAASNPTQGDLSKDVALNNPPEDSISELSFSPQTEHLAVASWDKKVRIYEISPTGQSEGKALFEHEAPVLSCCWSKDGGKVVGAGADKAARLLDLASGSTSPQQVAAHEQPIRTVRFIEAPGSGSPMLVTGSWDKTVKYWDLRQSNPVATLQCQERVYTMDVKDRLLVIGTADRYINVVNLNDPTKFYKTMQSPLKWQTRVVSCFNDATGFAVGSIEGRCAIQYVEDKDSNSNFSFKCHRQTPAGQTSTTNVYSVNSINFHPVHGTFSTSGSDGTFHFWDKDAKHRLKGYPEVGGTISATAFNRTGSIFAYAVSYDWSKGYAFNTPNSPNKIMLHSVNGDECKPRAGTKKR
ncbi:WD40 repeat-like protein [Xylona heveae TC161]|uniref:WD40 repeat-like protein n=1 Tax=Xylona heveae (strain CBS 132557 / TC161) TaxID=1328760 RepID=A0A165J448_XYLHT|nr:WD40 repeat-like protein [Xylona heveae TC161]KZF25703.1 WD40 repeat-like protein [Xylona heveae TC161]